MNNFTNRCFALLLTLGAMCCLPAHGAGENSPYVGCWLAGAPTVGGSFAEYYVFLPDGAFIHSSSQFDMLERERYKTGEWRTENGKLILTVRQQLVWIGGYAVEDEVVEYTLTGFEVELKTLDPPAVEVHTISTAKVDPDWHQEVIAIDGDAFYEYDNDSPDNMIGEYYVYLAMFGSPFSSGAYKYSLTDDRRAIITYCEGGDDELVIPGELDGYPVAGIGNWAFFYHGCWSLTTIVIPYGVESIGERAFYFFCGKTAAVHIPESVTVIGDNAFASEDCEVTLFVQAGSYAEAYAKENGIAYVYSE